VIKYKVMKEVVKNMRNRLYIATVCGQHKEILEKYNIGVELDQFCWAVQLEGEGRTSAFKEIDELIPLSKGNILHAPFNELFPAAIDPRARQMAMDRFNQAAEIAIKLGSDKMVVHTGYMPHVYYKEWHRDRSVEFWNEFMADKPDNFKIVIENVLDDEPYMMAEMIKLIDHPNIKLCFDCGHALCISDVDVMEWLEVMAPHLGHLHIHNNDGTHDYHRPLTDGQIDMKAFLDKALKLCTEDTTFTIESLDGVDSMEWLKNNGYI